MKIEFPPKGLQYAFVCTQINLRRTCVLFLLLFTMAAIAKAQTSAFKLTPIPFTDPDIIAPGRGAEQWNNGSQAITYPTQDLVQSSLDVYHRFTWNRLEGSAQGSYNWGEFNGLIKDAINKGQKLSFGIMTCYPDSDGQPGMVYYDDGNSAYPEYLHRLMQSEPVPDWKTNGSGSVDGHGSWVPNWNSKNYLARLKALHEALYAHIQSSSYTATAGPNKGKTIPYSLAIFSIDIRGYGSWGEWHSSGIIDEMGSYPAGTRATTVTLKTIIDHHVNVFTDHALSIMVSAFDGERLGNTLIPKEVGAYVLGKTNNWGRLGWRRDSWGAMDSYFDHYLKNNATFYGGSGPFNAIIMERWKYAPVTGEPLPGIADNCRFGDIEGQVKEYHATSVGNGNYGNNNLPDCTQEHIRAAMKAAGYRILVEGGSISSTIISGNNFEVSLAWKNTGIAPTYEKWDVVFELKDSSGSIVWSGISKFSPGAKNLTPALLPSAVATTAKDNFTLPAGVAAGGKYTLDLVIKDPAGYRSPLPLAIKGQNADGSYTLKTINVVAKATGPVVPEPAPPTIPPATASLTGIVMLQGRPEAPNAQWQVPLQVDLYADSNSTKIETYAIVTDASGRFVIDSIVPGVYHIAVKNSHTLKKINLSDTLVAGNNIIYFGILPEGDINNDNLVSAADSVLLMNSYNQVETDSAFDSRADLNEDHIVDSLDLVLFMANYNTPGDSLNEGCSLVTATIDNAAGCNDPAVELVLSSAKGTGPFDVVINGITYNDLSVGDTIATINDETIWSVNPDPTTDFDNPVELGVKFSSSVAGFIKGIRFFSGNTVSGNYTGHLWSVDGELLASAEFTNVTASGWQQVFFSEAIAIAPGTIYIASYYAEAGIYAGTNYGFDEAVSNGGSLTALSNTTEGGNGVYTYDGPGFPTNTHKASNYWVDVLFSSSPGKFELTSVTDRSTGCNNTKLFQTLAVSACPQQRGAASTAMVAQSELLLSKNQDGDIFKNELRQNYPNPFSNETVIHFSLAKPAKVNLSVFDVNGRLVKTIINSSKEAGEHVVKINAGSLARGIYFYKLQSGNYSAVKKMIIQ